MEKGICWLLAWRSERPAVRSSISLLPAPPSPGQDGTWQTPAWHIRGVSSRAEHGAGAEQRSGELMRSPSAASSQGQAVGFLLVGFLLMGFLLLPPLLCHRCRPPALLARWCGGPPPPPEADHGQLTGAAVQTRHHGLFKCSREQRKRIPSLPHPEHPRELSS